MSDYLIGKGASEGNLQARKPFTEADGRDHAGIRRIYAARLLMPVNILTGVPAPARHFVLGDEGMEGGGGTLTSAAVTKNSEAIGVAQLHGVKVYTYQGTPDDRPKTLIASRRLRKETK